MSNRRSAIVWSALLWLFATTAAPAAEPLKVSQRWALLIGVDDYAYAQKLQYCGADQRALRDQLVAAGFPKDHVFLLEDKTNDGRLRPSKSNVDRHLDLVLNLADADDLIVIGFSGHGVHLGGKSFLCPGDCNLDDPKTLVAVDELYDRLTKCAANFKLVVVDACRNDPRPGGTRSMQPTDGTRALARSLQEVKLPEGVVLLNSCAPGEVSWEDETLKHGVFMHFLLDGLKGAADTGNDGHVSLHELQSYAGVKTKTYVANHHRVPQRPFFKGDVTTEALEYALLPVPKIAKPTVTEPSVPKPSVAATPKPAATPPSTAQPSTSQPNTSQGSYSPSPSGGRDLNFDIGSIVPLGNANSNSPTAAEQHDLALDYAKGDGVSRDYAKALELFKLAAAKGLPEADYNLGVMYYNGYGVRQDYAKAMEYFLAAAKHKHADAENNIGSMIDNGEGVRNDPVKARGWFEAAASHGSTAGMYNLALGYEQGVWGPKNLLKAVELYRKAADLGYEPAKKKLDGLR